ncbi:uncharacterized protein TDEL_0C03660 [Torulaspora delbrueckii]|uniref:Cell wall mannoprotein PIR1-like C-terminal domain-containing protein n=1 Tax=Torulaspora delbrueckii TaxID=4950 RepID=G8ZRW3_TORDE|nr:hypothetical protein TDEL_0C03660 [Torulaspora delbrueckii]CCE91255.1 hypothetical protein TDEL_0C03660 [Torulaspora delbrueckii]
MLYRFAITAALASSALAAYAPSEPWATLTPTVTYSDGATDYDGTFGIAIKTLAAQSSSNSTVQKRDAVSQIGDGQIQATTATTAEAISQIDDGQIQATTATTAEAVSQIDDGQIQATTATTAEAVSQIGDGQIQATTATTADAVSQIGDGQIQATTATTATTDAVSQIGDGQIQATSATTTLAPASQIDDGQIQATSSTTTSDGASQSTDSASDGRVKAVSCKNDGTLEMSLNEGVLTDNKGRIGSIVANRQFQFDGPPPQAGAIYAAGWSITPEGNLAIGDEDVFYQCLSGNFYNLYDQSLGEQCKEVHLEVIDLVKC